MTTSTPTKQAQECDAFMADTYRSSADKAFHPGAIMLKKRRTVQVLRWDRKFASEEDANDYVREQLADKHLPEMLPDGTLVAV